MIVSLGSDIIAAELEEESAEVAFKFIISTFLTYSFLQLNESKKHIIIKMMMSDINLVCMDNFLAL